MNVREQAERDWEVFLRDNAEHKEVSNPARRDFMKIAFLYGWAQGAEHGIVESTRNMQRALKGMGLRDE